MIDDLCLTKSWDNAMKITKIALLFGGLFGMSAIANPYIQANVGISGYNADLNSSELDASIRDEDTFARLAVGSNSGNFRYALDYTHYGAIDDVKSITRKDNVVGLVNVTENAGYAIETEGVGLSLIADFNNDSSKVAPYVGARFSVNRSDVAVVSTASALGVTDGVLVATDGKATTVGMGAVLGVQYHVTPNFALDMSTEYNHLGKLDIKDDEGKIKLNQLGASVGARFSF